MTQDILNTALVRWFEEFAEHGIFTTDTRLTVTGWNRWLERHSGQPAGEVVGRPLAEAVPDLKERGLYEHYQEALDGHAYLISHSLHRYLLPIRTRVGDTLFEIMPQRARIAPLIAADQVVGTITVIDDVSERVASEQELRRQIQAQEAARAAAEAALRAKDDFLATLSHEIRTPLNAVLGWTRILRERQLDAEVFARGIDIIDRNTALQMRMMDDLLDTARIMAGKLRLQMERVDLAQVTVAAVEVIAPAAEAKGITITRTLEANSAPVLGDADRLQQVLWNLLSNALKFTDRGGTIAVHLQQVGHFVRVTVRDSGRGISPEFLPFVFDRFSQADNSSSRREMGLGLGLALVKELVNLHGGRIRAESEGLQKGASFVVDLPVLSGAHADLRAAGDSDGAPKHATSLHNIRVLVVEDDPDARDLLVTSLSEHGAGVVATASAAEAMEAVTGKRDGPRPDVVVADIGLAGQDGYDLIRRLRGVTARGERPIAAIAVSAYGGAEHRELARSSGYHSYLEKPLDVDELVRAIIRAVRAGV